MGTAVWIGFAAFFVVALVVGVRVLLLARRTRELPELLMGIGVLGIGPVGFGLMVIAQQLQTASPTLHSATLALGVFAVTCGALAKFVFNWRVYHPDSPVARAIALSASGGLLGTFVWTGVEGFELVATLSPHYLLRSALQIGCLLWGAGEAFGYWLKMRRRVRIGLGDPVVANRFLMWAIGAFAAGFGSAVGTVAQMISGQSIVEGGWVMVSSSMHGLVAAIAIALAFIPPAFYVRYIRDRGERHTAGVLV